MSEDPAREPARVSQLDKVKQEYTQAAREILARSMRGVAKTKLTPDRLTLVGVSLCLAGAVLVREAGGVVTEPDGADFMQTGAVLASNTALAPLIAQTLRGS